MRGERLNVRGKRPGPQGRVRLGEELAGSLRRERTVMSYSQRKYLERLMSGADPLPPIGDPFGLSLGGIRIQESPDVPRYTLPTEVMPGVPRPPGFRDEFNQLSLSVLGTTNVLPRGTAYMLAGHTLVMRPSDLVKLTSLV